MSFQKFPAKNLLRLQSSKKEGDLEVSPFQAPSCCFWAVLHGPMLFLEAASQILDASCIAFPTNFLPKRIAFLFQAGRQVLPMRHITPGFWPPTHGQYLLLRPRVSDSSGLLLMGGATGRLSLAPTFSWVSKT